MPKEELRERYFEWLHRSVYRVSKYDQDDTYSFRMLSRELLEIPYHYDIPRDELRVGDGIRLRYKFGAQFGYDDQTIVCSLDDKPCSVFEVMVALAKRCESDIMANPSYGNRTIQWYNDMIVSLGLGGQYNLNFDAAKVHEAAERMMNHEYEPNGKGGLFTVRHPIRDMRELELWSQMCDYLNEMLF